VFEQNDQRQLSVPSRSLCAVTDIGNNRKNNEDAYSFSLDCKLWVVADGMGGHAAGEVASALTVETIVETMESAAEAALSVRDRLMAAFTRAQLSVLTHGLQDSECRGMGSTAVAGFVDGDILHICYVGDARAYHWSEGRLRLITNDHSWVWQQLVTSGILTPEKARFHPQRGKLMQAIGSSDGIRPEHTAVTLKPEDRILLCTDGLWEALSDLDIHAIVAGEGSLLELAIALVDRANAEGSKDNVTAMLYQHSS